MMQDPYHHVYDSGIWTQSRCIWHENTVMDFFRHNLACRGYRAVSDNNKIWRRDTKTVVVCLVDDIVTCSEGYETAVPYLFDPDTLVITDNWINTPTQYQVARLPDSFFGIYQHCPDIDGWNPQRRFNFAVNRIDAKRLLLFLELTQRSELQGCHELTDYINFNCWNWHNTNVTAQDAQDNFQQEFQALGNLGDQYHETYEATFMAWLPRMPLRNHDLDHETAHVSAWLNMVPETYSSDNTVAISEKTFRVLCLPVPWMLYSGRNTVARLVSLGFDVLSDVISHRYDSMIENRTARYGDKNVDFVFEALDSVNSMMDRPFEDLNARCMRAARHNKQRLEHMALAWPSDFADWWKDVSRLI